MYQCAKAVVMKMLKREGDLRLEKSRTPRQALGHRKSAT